jgi:hypothetical protein
MRMWKELLITLPRTFPLVQEILFVKHIVGDDDPSRLLGKEFISCGKATSTNLVQQALEITAATTKEKNFEMQGAKTEEEARQMIIERPPSAFARVLWSRVPRFAFIATF